MLIQKNHSRDFYKHLNGGFSYRCCRKLAHKNCLMSKSSDWVFSLESKAKWNCRSKTKIRSMLRHDNPELYRSRSITRFIQFPLSPFRVLGACCSLHDFLRCKQFSARPYKNWHGLLLTCCWETRPRWMYCELIPKRWSRYSVWIGIIKNRMV